MRGVIKTFNQESGHGYIQYYDYHEIYFSYTDFSNKDYINLKEGLDVDFEIDNDRVKNAKVVESHKLP